MKITWNLRMLCAEKGLWTGAALNRRLRERLGLSLTSQTISNLISKNPKRLSLDVLLALCAVLDCTPNDLLKIETAITAQGARSLVEGIIAVNQPNAPRRRRRGPKKRLTPPPETHI